MAAVAMAHGINANPLRRWVREGEMKTDVPAHDKQSGDGAARPGPAFVPMAVPPVATTADIRIELRRGSIREGEALIDTQLGPFSAAKGLCAQIVYLDRAAMHAPDPRLGPAAATPNRKHRPNRSHTAIVRAAG